MLLFFCFQIEEEQRERDDLREQYLNAEKRASLLEAEKEELASTSAQVERSRKQAELEASDTRDQANELSVQVCSLNAAKRKIEGEIQVCYRSRTLEFRAFLMNLLGIIYTRNFFFWSSSA